MWLRDRLERTGVSECDWLENECGRSLATESADKKWREEELGRNAGNGGSVRILTDVDRNCTLNRPFCQFHSGPRKSGQTQYFCDFLASFHLSFDFGGTLKRSYWPQSHNLKRFSGLSSKNRLTGAAASPS
jgi:hypothetical protein